MLVRRLLFGATVTLAIGFVWANWPHDALPDGTSADRVLVRKAKRILEIYKGDSLLRTYHIALGSEPIGPKLEEGDGRTPEGRYSIDYVNRESAYYLSLHISYPSASDMVRARSAGVDPGGMIMIHGLPKRTAFLGRLHRFIDWTKGCIAMTNDEVDEVARVVAMGAPIELLP